MTKTVQKDGRMTEGVIWKQMLQFFFPILLGTFFQQLYTTADAVIVGQFVGKEALSAVGGSPAMIIQLLNGFFIGAASGATVIISQHFGANEAEDVHKGVHTAILLSIIGGAMMSILMLTLSSWTLQVMDTPADVMGDSLRYMQICAVGMIPSLVYNIGSGVFRAVGDSRRPLIYLIISCLLNIMLDLLFVLVIPLGVAGAAIATILSQMISALMVIVGLMRSKGIYRLELRKLHLDAEKLKQTLRIGMPNGIQTLFYSGSTLVIQTYINSFGTDTVAAWSAFVKVDNLFWMVITAFGVTITTFVGQNYGVKNYARVRRGVKVCTIAAAISTVFISTTVLLIGRNVFYLFVQDEAVIDIGTKMLQFMIPMYILYIMIEMLPGALRGMGDTFWPMIIAFVGICVVRLIWLFVGVPLYMSIYTVMFSYPLTWVVTSTAFIFYYRKRSKTLMPVNE